MANLITTTEFKALRDIGSKVDDTKLEECITLTQEGELFDLLGEFVFDVVDNVADPDYADLIDGSSFTVSGENYTHRGIKALLGDLVYARYIGVLNPVFTPFGIGYKEGDNLERLDKAEILRLVNNAQKDAQAKFSVIKIYLDNITPTVFTRWNNGYNPDFGMSRKKWTIIK